MKLQASSDRSYFHFKFIFTPYYKIQRGFEPAFNSHSPMPRFFESNFFLLLFQIFQLGSVRLKYANSQPVMATLGIEFESFVRSLVVCWSFFDWLKVNQIICSIFAYISLAYSHSLPNERAKVIRKNQLVWCVWKTPNELWWPTRLDSTRSAKPTWLSDVIRKKINQLTFSNQTRRESMSVCVSEIWDRRRAGKMWLLIFTNFAPTRLRAVGCRPAVLKLFFFSFSEFGSVRFRLDN